MRNRLQQLVSNTRATPPALRSEVTASDVTVWVDDVIDAYWGISAKDVAAALAGNADKALTVWINSPGGDVFEGRAIASLIRAHKGATKGIVAGLAASAASTIAVACGALEMSVGSFLMVHNSWAFTVGNRDDLRQMADLLEKIDGEIAADYAARAGVTKEEAAAWMAAETWFTAEEAVTAKLADVVLSAAADYPTKANLSGFDKAPKALVDAIAARRQAPDPAAIRDHSERRMRLLDIAV